MTDEFFVDFYMFLALFQKLAVACFAIWAMIRISSWLDQRANRHFTQTIERICETSMGAATYYGLRIVALALVIGMLAGCSAACASPFPNKYDREIKQAVATWWADYPFWHEWKAQLYQESRLDPNATSPVGARGLAQFMPGTWAQVQREMKLGITSPQSDLAIGAGAYYERKLRRQWSSPRPTQDRQALAEASYNAGLGSLLHAQKACDGKSLYREIIGCLPAVTGERSKETIAYVERIAYWRRMIDVEEVQ